MNWCAKMSCNTNENSATFILGEIKRIKLNVYQPKTNETLPTCSSVNIANIVVPTTITATSLNIKIYDCDDILNPIVNDTPLVVDIIDSKLQKIGIQISYSINTTISPLNVVGNYVAVFTYQIDSAETYVVPYYFGIEAIQNCSASGTC